MKNIIFWSQVFNMYKSINFYVINKIVFHLKLSFYILMVDRQMAESATITIIKEGRNIFSYFILFSIDQFKIYQLHFKDTMIN